MTRERSRSRSRSGAWWIADEELEVVSAERSQKPVISRVLRQRIAVLLGLALAAGMGTIFLL